MRKTLEILSLSALALQCLITGSALYGGARLPDKIPTHFNAAGQPDAWGSAHTLLVFPLIAAVLYTLMTVVARFPSAFNFPVRVTPRNRAQLEALALGMIAWLKSELMYSFAWIEWEAIRTAHHPDTGFSPYPMPLLLATVFATIAAYVASMFRAARKPMTGSNAQT